MAHHRLPLVLLGGALLLIGPMTQQARPAGPRKTAATWARIQRQGYFTVALDPDNLPYSAKVDAQPGFEVELAHALAKKLSLTAKIDWIGSRRETSLGKLLDGDCDLVMGLPIDPRLREDDEAAAPRIRYTNPYCRTGYLLFVRKNGPRLRRLQDVPENATNRIGTEAGSLGDFALKERGFKTMPHGSQAAALKALADSDIDYAYLWANAAWLVHSSKAKTLEVAQPFELADWRDMAAAVRRGNDEFVAQLNGALAALINEKVVERLLVRYGVPYYSVPQKVTLPVESSSPRNP